MGWILEHLPTDLAQKAREAMSKKSPTDFRTGGGVEGTRNHEVEHGSKSGNQMGGDLECSNTHSRVNDRPARPLGPGPDRESELHDDIVKFCHDREWLCITSRMDKRTTTVKGLTDFVIVTPQTVYFVEAKMPGKKMSPAQQAFAAQIKKLNWPHAVVHSFNEFKEFIEGRS